MQCCVRLSVCLCVGFASASPALAGKPTVWNAIVVGRQAVSEQLATVDLQRYLAQVAGRTPALLTVDEWRSNPEPAVLLGTVEGNSILDGLVAADLSGEAYLVLQTRMRGMPVIVATGRTPAGATNAIYGLLREAGFGFYLGSEAIPERLPDRLPADRVVRSPALGIRGVLPWYNFFNSPTTWDPIDHRTFADQLIRMGANFLGFHCYDNEPFAAFERDGEMRWGGRLLNTGAPTWGTHPLPTSLFAFGTHRLFADEFFGAATTLLSDPAGEVIRREQAIMRDALDYAKKRGLRTCLGFEIAGDPTQATDRQVFVRRVEHLLDTYPALDFIWIWQPETQGAQGFRETYNVHMLGSKLAEDSPLRQYGAARRDIFKRAVERTAGEPPFFQNNEGGKAARATEGARLEQYAVLAHQLLSRRQNPPRLVVSGWGGDERLLSAEYYDGLDKLLPKDVVFASLDHIIPRDRVDRAYHELPPDRERWPIPWLEYDGDQWHPQPFVRVYEAMFRDILRSGSQGVLGIHWRTREVEENFAYLVAASWQPDLTADAFFVDLARRCYPAEIADEMARIHADLDRLGYRWLGGGGQSECGGFGWNPGDPARVKTLLDIRSRLQSLLPKAGRSRSRVRWIIDRMDWVVGFQQAQESAIAAGGMLTQADAVSGEDATRLAADALARLGDGAMERALQAYARRVTTRGEYGVLATINAKAVVAWRELRARAGRTLRRDIPEPSIVDPPWEDTIVPRLYGSVPAGRAVRLEFINSATSCEARYGPVGHADTAAPVTALKGDVKVVEVPAAAVSAPALEVELRCGPQSDVRTIAFTVMPDLPVDTAPRARSQQFEVVTGLEIRATEGSRLPVELTWAASPPAEFYKVFRDGRLVADTAVPFYPDAPGRTQATYLVEAWSGEKRLGASQPLQVRTPDHPVVEKPVVTARVTGAGVTLEWPATSDPRIIEYRVAREARGALAGRQMASVSASRDGKHLFRDRPPAGEWTYRIAGVNAAGRAGGWGKVDVSSVASQAVKPVITLPLTERPANADVIGRVEFTPNGARLGEGHLVIPHDEAFGLGGPMTVAFEFKADAIGDMPVFLCSGQWRVDGWFAQILGGAFVVRTADADAQGPVIRPGEWYLVRFVFDGSHIELFINGEAAGPATAARPVPGSRGLVIGQYDQVERRYAFKGLIRNLEVYSDAVVP